ncbi:MAG: hypothetical protein ACTTGZ_06460 [Treponema sp.]
MKSFTKPLFVSLLVTLAVSCTNTIVSSDSGGGGSSGSSAAKPEITKQPQSLTYMLGETGKILEVEAKSPDGGELSYQWYKDGGVIRNENNSRYVLKISKAGTYKFFVRITNKLGSSTNFVDSDEVTITVKEPAPLVDAQTPVFKTHPVSGEHNLKADVTLTVKAEVSDSGAVTYQWYRNDSPISGATGESFKADTSALGETSYKVQAENKNDSATGKKKASAFSNVATIRIVDSSKTNAKVPSISAHPASKTYNKGDAPVVLTVTASSNDSGNLTYQWYVNGKEIDGATTSSYTPKTDEAGEFTYYVKVTNTITDNGDGGLKSASATSENAVITVKELVNAQTPKIHKQPIGATYKKGDTAAVLNVSATVSDKGKLSYKWYKDGTEISGADKAEYKPATDTIGTFKYTVKILNNLESATGNKNAEITSSEAVITVNDPDKTNAAVPKEINVSGKNVYDKGDKAAEPLTVTAKSTDGGVLSYQWYLNGEAITGATQNTYTPKTDTEGEFKYKVKVINTLASATGNQKAEKFSNEISVVVRPTEGTGGISGDFNPQP